LRNIFILLFGDFSTLFVPQEQQTTPKKKGEKADHIPLFRLFSVGQDAEAYKR
jgi:hypothetical protein